MNFDLIWKKLVYFLIYNPMRNVACFGVLLIAFSIFLLFKSGPVFFLANGVALILIAVIQAMAHDAEGTKIYKEKEHV